MTERQGPRQQIIAGATSNTESTRPTERESTPERLLVPTFDVLNLVGGPGTGTTTTANLILEAVLNLEQFKAGESLRYAITRETGQPPPLNFTASESDDITT